MLSKFEDPLKLIDGAIEACGELKWDAGEEEAVVAVTITQKHEKIHGSESSPPSFGPGDDEWMLKVEAAGGKKFKRGPARAVGVVSVVGSKGDPFEWHQELELS